jgi:tetratricopeptide (TPR) repeat protein
LALLVPWCQARPDDATALQLLAHVCLERGALDDAEALLQRVLALQPDLAPARFDRARLLHIRLDAAGALEALGPLIRSDPDHPAWANLNASCLTMLGDDAAAAAQLARLVQRFPDNPQIRVNHGRVLRVLGAHDEAVAAFRHALAVAPHCGEAWYALANLKSGTLTAADARAMATALTSALDDADRLAIEYALGTWAEQAGDPARAFAHYQRGAALMQQRLGDDRIAHARTGVAHARAYTPALIAARGDWGCDDRAPIFIVGMPRSGSTLVEQILSCHPVIEGTMELPYIGLIAQQVAKRGGPHALDRDQARQLGETYLRQAAVHRRLGRAHFLDKMPGNFMHIGLIRLILPNARIIDVRRHPMATCFSNYRQLFTGGQDYSYDLADLAFAYRSYLHVMRHFQQAAPGFVRTQIHEDLVDDAEGQVRALLAWLDLPFDPATLRFYENDRAVRTVSSEQVRRPIYRSGLDQWRAFEPQLAPLAAGLGDALDSWRD